MRQLQIAVFAVSAALSAGLAAAETTSKAVSKTLPLAAGEGVRVDTYKGSVKVTTWDKAEVAVEARVEADPDCGSASQQARWVDQTRVEIEKSASGVSIVSDYDRLDEASGWFGGCTSRPFVHYVIRMPKSAPLRIKDYKSDLSVADLEASLSVETYKGSLDVKAQSGALDVETYKGDVKAGLVRLAGDVRAETYKGTIAIRLPESAGFQLSAEAGRRGEFRSDFPTPLASSSRRSLQARGTVNGGGPRVSLRTDKGSLSLRKG